MKQFCIFCLLHGSHATRHAEGRGYGREDRDGGLNDEAPYLSFLFIHDFSCWFKGSIMRTFFSSFGFVALRFAGLSPAGGKVRNPRSAIQGSLGGKGRGQDGKGRSNRVAKFLCWRRGRVARGKPPGARPPLLRRAGGRVGGWCSLGRSRRGYKQASAIRWAVRLCRPAPWVNRPGCRRPRRYPGLRRPWWPS